jgi:hypothetical protein
MNVSTGHHLQGETGATEAQLLRVIQIVAHHRDPEDIHRIRDTWTAGAILSALIPPGYAVTELQKSPEQRYGLASLTCRHGVSGYFTGCPDCQRERLEIESASSQEEAEAIAAKYSGPAR